MDELATRAGLHRTYIGLLERAERQPTVVAAADIAAALGTRLSDLIRQAEQDGFGRPGDAPVPAEPEIDVIHRPAPRLARPDAFRGDAETRRLTGLDSSAIGTALELAYHQFDVMDEQLIESGGAPICELFELANVSSMMGNLLSAGLAHASDGRYVRNRPHAFPDLLSQLPDFPNLEVKVALETNMPKGHLAKAGVYFTFRYVLIDRSGTYTRGRPNRGTVAEVWDVRCGNLALDDFSLSNTPGDSGKTAVIKRGAFDRMELAYYVRDLNPYARPPQRFSSF